MHQHTNSMLLTIMVLCWSSISHATEEHHKRAPSGFLGVRGKKSISDAEYKADLEENSVNKESLEPPEQNSPQTVPENFLLMNKRAPYTSGFVGMRGKKPAWYYTDGAFYKRAPQGFFGMRGKKNGAVDEDYFEGYVKRAPMGFFGMRGKKYVSQSYLQDEKRAPNSGFFGVRGKKDYEDLFYDVDDKRAPLSAFYGVRGKRMGFFGVRGKKIPYEFRGKFVGVRGKKSQPNMLSGESNKNGLREYKLMSKYPNDLDVNQLMLLLTEQNSNDENNEVSKF